MIRIFGFALLGSCFRLQSVFSVLPVCWGLDSFSWVVFFGQWVVNGIEGFVFVFLWGSGLCCRSSLGCSSCCWVDGGE